MFVAVLQQCNPDGLSVASYQLATPRDHVTSSSFFPSQSASVSFFVHLADFDKLERRYTLAWYILMSRVCWTVCPSLCLSVTRRYCTKTAWRRLTERTPYNSTGSFLVPKISAKFQWDQPQQGRQIQEEWVKIGDFRLVSRYVSETVQDIITIEG